MDPFPPPWDAAALYITGTELPNGPKPDFAAYDDPHIKLREILFLDDSQYYHYQNSPDEDWKLEVYNSPTAIAEQFFLDMFNRKAGLNA